MSDNVPVSRALLTAGGLVLVASLTLSAFLLGRATAPSPNIVVQAPSSDGGPSAQLQPTSPRAHDDPTGLALDTQPAAASPQTPKTASTTPPSDDDQRKQVRSYFRSLDGLQGSIMDGLDPQALVQQALSGDTSGIDQLIAQHRSRMNQIGKLPVPRACETHHTNLMALGRDGLSVMTRLRDGIASNDINALMALQGDAGRLQRKGDQLNDLEDELRRRYGA